MPTSPAPSSGRRMIEPGRREADAGADPQERREYRYRQVVSHLSSAEAWTQLFALLEDKPFLADQADFLGGFEVTGADIERHALTAAVRIADWDRFLRYSSMALSLRGLAEGLAEPEILRALVQGNRLALARDAVDRLAEAPRRAAARAVLAAACRSRHGSAVPELLRGIEEDLEAAPPTSAILSTIARCLGPELSSRWREWTGRLPDGAGAVWAAVAESWLERGETGSAALWTALAEIGDPRRVLELITRIGEIDRGEIGERFARIHSLFGEDVVSRRHALAAFLSRQSRCRPEAAVAAWSLWMACEPIPWTAALVEACRELIQRLEPRRIETFCATLETPEAVAAARVADLEAHPEDRRAATALQAVSRIPDGPAKLHWSLRYLAARPLEPAGEVRGQVGAVAAYLHELRYDVDGRDLCRFLDLADPFFPRDLSRLIEDVAWSPSSRPETLLTLATETTRERVAELLLETAERFAAAVSLTEAEGFRLRGELIRRAACRLCLLRTDLKGFFIASGRLLPEEEDALREALAPALAASGRRAQAAEIADGIGNARQRFLTQLRILPDGKIPETYLASRSLYAAMASTQPIEEERLALTALLANPFDPQELLRQWIAPIPSGELQTAALLRLARQTLAFQRSFYRRRQDPTAALEVVRGSIAVETDEQLAALTPEIAALGAEAGPREAVSELQEAARQLADLTTVAWTTRLHAFEALLAAVSPIFLTGRQKPGRRHLRRVLAVLEAVARLPIGPRPKPGLDELRSRWHEILPILLAAADRLPRIAPSFFLALRAGMVACQDAGGGAAKTIFSFCLAPATERLGLAASPHPELAGALAYLLAGRRPARLPEILQPLDPAIRDALILRLVRFRWLPEGSAAPLVSSIADPVRREEAALWAWRDGRDSEGWIALLAKLVSSRRLDPSAPGTQEILDRLWACEPATSRPALAGAFANAVRASRERGEAALRLWLHAHLAPRPGTGNAEGLRRSEGAKRALALSLELSP